MVKTNIKNEILEYALEALKKNIALPIVIEEETGETIQTLEAGWLLRLRVRDTELHFYAEVKTNITTAEIGMILFKKTEFPYPILLLTKHVTGRVAEQLKKNEIQFIDTAGNAYINQTPLYIFVKGNKPPDIFRQAPLGRAFQPTGLKVIYAFLCNPGLEKKPHREIAKAADVALGTITYVMKDLKEKGYLVDMGKQGRKLVKKEGLLKRWVAYYPEKLRPKLLLGRFRGPRDWWQQRTLHPGYAQWGGEVAAAKLTKYLKPEIITIYIDSQQLSVLLIGNRLARDPEGDIEILKRFWAQTELWEYKPMDQEYKPIIPTNRGLPVPKDMVNPILIYADLMATGDQRNIETAKVIYEKYIVRLIRKD